MKKTICSLLAAGMMIGGCGATGYQIKYAPYNSQVGRPLKNPTIALQNLSNVMAKYEYTVTTHGFLKDGMECDLRLKPTPKFNSFTKQWETKYDTYCNVEAYRVVQDVKYDEITSIVHKDFDVTINSNIKIHTTSTKDARDIAANLEHLTSNYNPAKVPLIKDLEEEKKGNGWVKLENDKEKEKFKTTMAGIVTTLIGTGFFLGYQEKKEPIIGSMAVIFTFGGLGLFAYGMGMDDE